MSNSTKYQAVKNHPGIYRKLVLRGSKWVEANKPYASIYLRDVGKPRRQRERRSFGSLKEAIEYRCFGSANRPQIVATETAKTFRQLRDEWSRIYRQSVEVSTWIRTESYLKHFKYFEELSVDSINSNVVDDWLLMLRSPDYLATQHSTRRDYRHEFSVLRSILKFHREATPTYQLPFLDRHRKLLDLGIRQVSPKKDLTVEEYNRFLVELRIICEGTALEYIYYIAVFQYSLGLRVQEAVALDFESFDFEKNEVTICHKIIWLRKKGHEAFVKRGTKANPGKIVPMPDLARAALNQWKLRSGLREGYLFLREGRIPQYRKIEYRFSQALKRAGLKFSATHVLRHAFLTEFYQQTHDLESTKRMAGHSSLKSTEKYIGVRSDHLKKQVAKLDEVQSKIKI